MGFLHKEGGGKTTLHICACTPCSDAFTVGDPCPACALRVLKVLRIHTP
jgi:hypothetical protein